MRASLLRDPAVLVASGFGAGLAPSAPGTFGTLLAIPFWWMLAGSGTIIYLALAATGFIGGVWICNRAAAVLEKHDDPAIVIDEVVGYFAAMVVVPREVHWVVVSFFVFRMFDILKPWPISWIDRTVRGGLGVMLDDLVAGLFTTAVVLAAIRWVG